VKWTWRNTWELLASALAGGSILVCIVLLERYLWGHG
jgi:hypothetical protein